MIQPTQVKKIIQARPRKVSNGTKLTFREHPRNKA